MPAEWKIACIYRLPQFMHDYTFHIKYQKICLYYFGNMNKLILLLVDTALLEHGFEKNVLCATCVHFPQCMHDQSYRTCSTKKCEVHVHLQRE